MLTIDGKTGATIREISVWVPQRTRNIYLVIKQKDLSREVPAAGFTGGRGRLNRESAALPTESPWAFSRLARATGAWGSTGEHAQAMQRCSHCRAGHGGLFSLENLLSGFICRSKESRMPLANH